MKGISPLLAAVLLIAVTVAIATLVMGWVSTTVRTTQTTVSNKTVEAVDCSSAGLVIDDVYIASTGTTAPARAIVRNSGYIDGLTLISAQFYNSTGGNFTTTTSLGDLSKGQIATLAFTVSVGSCPTNFGEVIVTTSDCGGISAVFDRTPHC
ncbi:MAG: hypothetical protein HYY37_01300 [Candidatus Aenigmarchaeota archaeon]|nr:hypothetical protein [Candidatus Aenigmarchaeota archaeon]